MAKKSSGDNTPNQNLKSFQQIQQEKMDSANEIFQKTQARVQKANQAPPAPMSWPSKVVAPGNDEGK